MLPRRSTSTSPATSRGSLSATSNNITVNPNTTATQLVFGQQPTNTTAGVAINPKVTVKIEDQYGNVETGDNASSLSIAIASGPTGATFANGSTLTATVSAGVATFNNLKLNSAGNYTLQASDASPSLTSAPSNIFVVSPNTTATQLVFGQQPTANNRRRRHQPSGDGQDRGPVRQRRDGDNLSSLSLAIASGPTGASFASGSTTTATVSAGVATFTTVILDTAGTNYTLQASDASPSLTSLPSKTFAVNPNDATQLVFGQQPTATTAGAAINAAINPAGVMVKIEDQYGNVETGDTSSKLSIAIASGPTVASFASGSTTTVTVNDGVATFTTLVLDTAGTTYTLQASDASPSLTSLPSNSFVVSPNTTATQLVFGQQPTATTAGAAIMPPSIRRG